MALRRRASQPPVSRAPPRYGDIDDSDYVHDEIKVLAERTRQALIAQRRMDEQVILEGLRQYGPSDGSREIMMKEKLAADTAAMSGVYVVMRHLPTGKDCCRVGPSHTCFCGHTLSDHSRGSGRSSNQVKCGTPGCTCRCFQYIPNRPEEIGEGWLVRRSNFDIATWSAKCRCGHGSKHHAPNASKCRQCHCSAYESHFACISCDRGWEEHETVFETEQDRLRQGRPVGDAFAPLSDVNPEIGQIVFSGERNPRRAEIENGGPACTHLLLPDPSTSSYGTTPNRMAIQQQPQRQTVTLPDGRRLTLGAPRASSRGAGSSQRKKCGCGTSYSGTQCPRCGTRQ